MYCYLFGVTGVVIIVLEIGVVLNIKQLVQVCVYMYVCMYVVSEWYLILFNRNYWTVPHRSTSTPPYPWWRPSLPTYIHTYIIVLKIVFPPTHRTWTSFSWERRKHSKRKTVITAYPSCRRIFAYPPIPLSARASNP